MTASVLRHMAEWAGLEPAVTGTKIPCLTYLATTQYHVLSHQWLRSIFPVGAEDSSSIPSVTSIAIAATTSNAMLDEVFFRSQIVVIHVKVAAEATVDAGIASIHALSSLSHFSHSILPAEILEPRYTPA